MQLLGLDRSHKSLSNAAVMRGSYHELERAYSDIPL